MKTKSKTKMFDWDKLFKTSGYWMETIQNDLSGYVLDYLEKNRKKIQDFANEFGESNGYVGKIINGKFDGKLSELIKLYLFLGKTPKIVGYDLNTYANKLSQDISETQRMKLIQKRICMTMDIGVQGNLFGGKMLSFLDESGAILASEVMGSKSIVTAHMDEVNFVKPVKVHDIIHILGRVEKYGETSVTIYLEANTYDPDNEQSVLVCSTKMVFVHIGEDGHSKPYKKYGAND